MIELIIVIAIIAIMSVIALPRLSGFLGSAREESSLLKAYIEAVTDDSYTQKKTNYLCIHLDKPGEKESELFDDKFGDNNLVNVYVFNDGKFSPTKGNVLKPRSFSSSFILDEVILSGGKSIKSGNVLIPFYSDGTSEGFILKIVSGDKKINLIKNRINRLVLLGNEM